MRLLKLPYLIAKVLYLKARIAIARRRHPEWWGQGQRIDRERMQALRRLLPQVKRPCLGCGVLIEQGRRCPSCQRTHEEHVVRRQQHVATEGSGNDSAGRP